jgi:hypothetical protein
MIPKANPHSLKVGRLSAQFSWRVTLATTFSPRFTIISPRFHQPIFAFRRLPIAEDFRPISRRKPRTNPELTTAHHKPQRLVLSTAKWSSHAY